MRAPSLPRTAFASLTGRQAAAVLVLLAVSIGLCLVLVEPDARQPIGNGGNDLELYQAVVDRVASGENYYRAAGDELRAREFPTRSVFCWRTPLYAWFLGGLPDRAWGQRLLAGLAILAMATLFRALVVEGGIATASFGVVLLFGSLHGAFLGPGSLAFLFTELWAGTLIVLSVGMFAIGCRPLGVVAGLLALFFRELALPYVLICLGLSWRAYRRGERLAWVVGLVLYALYFAIHANNVGHHHTAADLPPPSGWIRWGGVRFLLATCSMNSLLLVMPKAVTAVYLPMAVLGLIGWPGETGQRVRLAGLAYLAAFSIAGNPFNFYWGLLNAGLLSLGAAWSPRAVRDLLRTRPPRPYSSSWVSCSMTASG